MAEYNPYSSQKDKARKINVLFSTNSSRDFPPGLMNESRTGCFLNATVQALAMIGRFRTAVINRTSKTKHGRRTTEDDVLQAFKTVVCNLQYSGQIVDPDVFIKAIPQQILKRGEQQDVHELLVYLLRHQGRNVCLYAKESMRIC